MFRLLRIAALLALLVTPATAQSVQGGTVGGGGFSSSGGSFQSFGAVNGVSGFSSNGSFRSSGGNVSALTVGSNQAPSLFGGGSPTAGPAGAGGGGGGGGCDLGGRSPTGIPLWFAWAGLLVAALRRRAA